MSKILIWNSISFSLCNNSPPRCAYCLCLCKCVPNVYVYFNADIRAISITITIDSSHMIHFPYKKKINIALKAIWTTTTTSETMNDDDDVDDFVSDEANNVHALWNFIYISSINILVYVHIRIFLHRMALIVLDFKHRSWS